MSITEAQRAHTCLRQTSDTQYSTKLTPSTGYEKLGLFFSLA
jgi:hypothetical protein